MLHNYHFYFIYDIKPANFSVFSLGRVSNQKTFGISVAVVLQGRSHSLTLNHQRQSTEGKYDVLK